MKNIFSLLIPKDKTGVKSLFPIIIHEYDSFNFKQSEKDLIECAYEERRNDPVGEEKSNVGGWQSSLIYHFVRLYNQMSLERDLTTISGFIRQEVERYFTTHKVLKEGTGCHVEKMWININKKGDYNLKHNHEDGSHYSGYLFLKGSKDSGNIVFDNPYLNQLGGEIRYYHPEISKSFNVFSDFEVVPTPGKIVMFPSFLIHKIGLNKSNEDQISVYFNIKLI